MSDGVARCVQDGVNAQLAFDITSGTVQVAASKELSITVPLVPILDRLRHLISSSVRVLDMQGGLLVRDYIRVDTAIIHANDQATFGNNPPSSIASLQAVAGYIAYKISCLLSSDVSSP